MFDQKAHTIMGQRTTRQLCEGLMLVEAQIAHHRTQPVKDVAAIQNLNQVRIWLIGELENRYDVEDALNRWADSDSPLTYGEALIQALPDDALA